MASSDPLSSPSPTPEPQTERHSLPTAPNKTAKDPGLDTGSELSELTEEEQDAENVEDDAAEDDEVRPRQPSRGAHKKRRSLVPEPMWDWAYKQKKEVKSKVVEEEEEEEEQDGPPRAMEEEEEDEDEQPGTSSHRGAKSVPHHVVDSEEDVDPAEEDKSPILARHKVDRVLPQRGPRPHPQYPGGSEEDVHMAKVDEQPILARSKSERGPDQEGFAATDSANEEDIDPDVDDLVPDRSVGPIKDNSADLTEDEEDEDEDGVPSEDAAPDDEDSGDETASDELGDGPDDVEVEADGDAVDIDSGHVTPTPTNNIMNGAAALMGIDVTAPSPAAVAPVVALAAASSIMAGSAMIEDPSPSDSASPASSRSVSPSLNDSTKKTSPKKDVGEVAPDGDREDQEPLEDDAAPAEGGELGAEGMEVDGREPETELLPAHRAEALDVLAMIELKFTLLKEKVYTERMHALAWEEYLVSEGSHPELLHLQEELAKRRDNRLDLAVRKRSHATANTLKRRRANEDSVWAWWKHARDELQTDMLAETNRKRRKLERDRRAAEVAQPVRHIPLPPQEIPVPPTLYDIVNQTLGSRHKRNSHAPPLVYPQLSTLSSADVSHDLDILSNNRRSFEANRPMNGPLGMHMPLNNIPFEGYASGVIDGPFFGAGGLGSRAPSQHVQMQHIGSGFPGPGGSGLRRQPSGSHQEFAPHPYEHDMMPGPAPMHIQPVGAGSVGNGYPPHGSMMSRSISPVHVMGNGSLVPSVPKVNGWAGGSGGLSGKMGGEWNGEPRRISPEDGFYRDLDREGREGAMDSEREKARERYERDRARERDLDRERQMEFQYMQQQQQQQQYHRNAPPPNSYPHVHVGPGQAPHHHVIGPHHHHHLHHHHHHHPTGGAPNGVASTPMSPLHHGHSSPRMHSTREIEYNRPHSGPPSTEIINLTPSSSKHYPSSLGPSSSMSGQWRSDMPPSPQYNRERGRPPSGPPPVGPHERVMTPFVATPTQHQSSQHVPSGSGQRHPPSVGPSRRGSFDDGLPRPPSSMHTNPGTLHGHGHGSSPMHRPLGAGSLSGGISHPSRTTADPMMGISPPRSNRLPPPPSPSSSVRTPPRLVHTVPPLPPPPYPTGIEAAAAGKSVLVVPISPSTTKKRASPPPTKMTIVDGLPPRASSRVGTPPSLPPHMSGTGPGPLLPPRTGSPSLLPSQTTHHPPNQNQSFPPMALPVPRLSSMSGPMDGPPPPKVAVGDIS